MADLWARQPGEPSRAFHCFTHYRDLGALRSIVKAQRAHHTDCPDASGRDPKYWKQLSRRWGWVHRAAAWDAHIDRQCWQASADDQVAARVRHIRLSQGVQAVALQSVRAVLEAVHDGEIMRLLVDRARRDPDAMMTLLNLCVRAAAVFPALVQTERDALGITADQPPYAITARRSLLADQIGTDPIATSLAIALLDRLSGSKTPPKTPPDRGVTRH